MLHSLHKFNLSFYRFSSLGFKQFCFLVNFYCDFLFCCFVHANSNNSVCSGADYFTNCVIVHWLILAELFIITIFKLNSNWRCKLSLGSLKIKLLFSFSCQNLQKFLIINMLFLLFLLWRIWKRSIRFLFCRSHICSCSSTRRVIFLFNFIRLCCSRRN